MSTGLPWTLGMSRGAQIRRVVHDRGERVQHGALRGRVVPIPYEVIDGRRRFQVQVDVHAARQVQIPSGALPAEREDRDRCERVPTRVPAAEPKARPRGNVRRIRLQRARGEGPHGLVGVGGADLGRPRRHPQALRNAHFAGGGHARFAQREARRYHERVQRHRHRGSFRAAGKRETHHGNVRAPADLSHPDVGRIERETRRALRGSGDVGAKDRARDDCEESEPAEE
jgi:hypothetical protein